MWNPRALCVVFVAFLGVVAPCSASEEGRVYTVFKEYRLALNEEVTSRGLSRYMSRSVLEYYLDYIAHAPTEDERQLRAQSMMSFVTFGDVVSKVFGYEVNFPSKKVAQLTIFSSDHQGHVPSQLHIDFVREGDSWKISAFHYDTSKKAQHSRTGLVDEFEGS